ncbi:MAG: hypothetical protein A2X48_13045 [Lentisphaerae bacterium GWF2_49_21]|nr:MAG: hypothetical protein A2X48_13045 [Lentisphaerae bacterium GWF2_49_21]
MDKTKPVAFIAIDLGASNGRIIIGSLCSGKLSLKTVHRFEHAICEIRNKKCWDWQFIQDSIFQGLKIAAGILGDQQPKSIGCTSWAQDFGLLDKKGKICYPPVSYRDNRTQGMPKAFSVIIKPTELHCHNGSALMPITTLCQLKAMADAEQETLQEANGLLHIADLVNCLLCGAVKTDWTMATASQMINVNNEAWDEQLLRKMSIPKKLLPEFIKQPGVIGSFQATDKELLPWQGIPVISGGGHDTAAAVYAIQPLPANAAFVSLGTWSMPGIETRGFLLPEISEAEELCPLGIPGGDWALFHPGTGLWLIQECRKEWQKQGKTCEYSELVNLARNSPSDSLIPVNDPRFFAPKNMLEEIRNCCIEQNFYEPNSIGDCARIIFRSLACQVSKSVKLLAESTGQELQHLHVLSGAVNNIFLCQEIANFSEIPVIAGPVEATVVGNLLLQAEVGRFIAGKQEKQAVLQASFKLKKYQPKDPHE